MTDYTFPPAPDIEQAYRSATTALAALVPQTSPGISRPDTLLDLLSAWPQLVADADLAVTAQIGPSVSWTSPRCDEDWDLIATGVDLDHDDRDLGEIRLGEDAFEGLYGGWAGGALDRAGLVYKRACGWDFAPGDAGIWLLMLAPVSAGSAGDDLWSFSGRLCGFVVVYDRDHDDKYESVAHIWTAAAWRRRGIARRLLTEARARFPITNIEEPYSPDGAAFLNASPPSEPKDAPEQPPER